MRILFVTSRFPFPPRKGDQTRAYHEIRGLGLRHEIDLISGSETPVTSADVAELAPFCRRIEIVPIRRNAAAARIAGRGAFSSLPFQVLYFDDPAMRRAVGEALRETTYDVVHAQLLRVLPALWEVGIPPVVVDLMDAFALGIAERRERAHPLLRPLFELERGRVAAYEARAIARFAQLVVISASDRARLGGDPKLRAIGHGVDGASFPFGETAGRDERTAIMTGNFGYGPNVDAAVWFARTIWPRIRAVRPEARCRFVGVRPTRAVRALAGDGIEVAGPVADVGSELRRAAVALAPMRSGAGIQSKVLEALASGTPVVSTALGNRGVGAVPERDLLIADDSVTFASGVVALFDDAARRARLGAAGRAFVETHHAWANHVAELEAVYARVIRP